MVIDLPYFDLLTTATSVNLSLELEALDSTNLTQSGYLETHPELQLLFAVLLSVIAVMGIFGNVLVILTVSVTRILRTPSNMFIMNLAVADLVITTVVDPFNIMGAFLGATFFAENSILCQMIASLCAPACLCSMMSICAISVNRYIMICHYHRYDRIFTWEKTAGMCLGLWLLSYCLHLPNHVGWGHNDFDPTYYVCTFSIATHSYAVFYISLGVFVPLVIVLFSYASIFHRYWQVKREIRRRKHASLEMQNSMTVSGTNVMFVNRTSHTTTLARLQVPLIQNSPGWTSMSNGSISPTDNTGPTVTSQGNGSTAVVSRDRTVSSVQLQIQYPKREFTSDDIKLAKTLFTVFIAFLVCWSPFSILVLMKQPDYIPGWIYVVAITMAHGNSSINSILYGITNEKFRQGYKRVLGFQVTHHALKTTTGRSISRPRRESTLRRKVHRPTAQVPPLPATVPISSFSVSVSGNKPLAVRARKEVMTDLTTIARPKTLLNADKVVKKPVGLKLSLSDQLLSPNGIVIIVPESP